MSECVVRMEMPESCPCDLVGYGYSMCCSAVSGIPKRVAEYDECVKNGTKPEWCPIICQLPEGHGRLVESNQVAKMIDRWIGYLDEDMIYRIKFALNRDVPTIIPADTAERSKHERTD